MQRKEKNQVLMLFYLIFHTNESLLLRMLNPNNFDCIIFEIKKCMLSMLADPFR